MSKKIALIGGGGFAKEIIEVMELLGHSVYGIFAHTNSFMEYHHYGYLDELLIHRGEYDAVHIAFGGVTGEQIANRRAIIDFLDRNGIDAVTLVSPYARIAKNVTLGQGCYIAHDVYISQDAAVGDHVIINNRCDIGHDVVIRENVTISPKVFLGGAVEVGSDTLIGVGSIVKQGVKIGHTSIVSMGSSVIRNIKPYSLVLAPQSTVHKEFYKNEQ